MIIKQNNRDAWVIETKTPLKTNRQILTEGKECFAGKIGSQ